jgi:hypothetical protein
VKYTPEYFKVKEKDAANHKLNETKEKTVKEVTDLIDRDEKKIRLKPSAAL